ncbi:hypothetical protein FHR90_000166 [Endobacter medicaginis]|uniref:2'-5' RNA ligase family protein n=1 Tax=Endobacter medicaginis TaxID=1181271 RepID=A0A839UWC9_9PROT|nr:2'-5' RNA ligase family protein [Endobacter medicaginis]MBB3172360.1 hypothetical protein [Endobacter medicaginis]MCX5476303.1 2'-5' RNA ligase family protein [Endobacter medicaginis]NVN29729.1 2'-5' RNA ligase family protein [Endobacter medicaginis]
MAETSPLILTAELDGPAQGWAQAMRERHFPPERNIVPAHVTLFHALPGDLEALFRTCPLSARPAPSVRIAAPFALGRGVAYRLICPELACLRDDLLAALPATRLTRQDLSPWWPHLTIQNKVEPERARALLAELSAGGMPIDTHAVALRLWRYLGGPWALLARLAFAPPV